MTHNADSHDSDVSPDLTHTDADGDGVGGWLVEGGGGNSASRPSHIKLPSQIENFFTASIPPSVCDVLLSEALDLRFSGSIDARVGISLNELNHGKRKTEIVWLPAGWHDGMFMDFGMSANAVWGYEVTGSEGMQVGWYADGGHYDWHADFDPYDRSRGYHRKVTVVCCLSDSSDYEGGELELRQRDGTPLRMKLGKGDMVAFPSWVQHRVAPVTGGVRVTAVKWLTGGFWK